MTLREPVTAANDTPKTATWTKMATDKYCRCDHCWTDAHVVVIGLFRCAYIRLGHSAITWRQCRKPFTLHTSRQCRHTQMVTTRF